MIKKANIPVGQEAKDQKELAGKVAMLTTGKISAGLSELAYAIKVLVYTESPVYFGLLDINDDNIFLDPFLFAYFNNPNTAGRPLLEQLLFGYIAAGSRPAEVNIRLDGNGVAYLPRIGYFQLEKERWGLQEATLKIEPDGSYAPYNGNSRLPHHFSAIKTIQGFEVSVFGSPMLYPYFTSACPAAAAHFNEIDFSVISRKHYDNLDRALTIISQSCPDYFRQLRLTNRRIVLYDYFQVNSFATKTIHGCVFLCSSSDSGIAFFLDDLVHQMSHNLLNSFITEITDYFCIDAEVRLLNEFIPAEREKRSVYSAFHGLFTVAQRAMCFDKMYRRKEWFTDTELHELIARYCDQHRRYRTGLEKVDLSVVYTEKGRKLYSQINKCADDALSAISHIIAATDFSNQVSRFNYQKFCEANPMGKCKELGFL